MLRRTGRISPLGIALQDMLRTQDLQEALRPHKARAIWAEVVGPEIAGATNAEAVRGGVLFVRVKSAVWSNELTFYKQDILNRINGRLGGRVLSDIHFKTSGRAMAPQRERPVEQELPSKIALAKIEPTGPLADAAKSLNAISDPESDNRLRSALNRVAQTQTWKRDHGWIPCDACGALFDPGPSAPTNVSRCPYCVTLG